MKISKEFQIGLLTLVSGVILYIGFNYLKGEHVFSSARFYYTVYDDVGGLQISNPVKVNGLVVGRVSDITIMQDDGNQMQIEFEVDDEIQVKEGSKAILMDDGLLGGKMIDLELGKGAILEDFTIVEGKILESMSATLQQQAAPMMGSADVVMQNINKLIADYSKMSGDIHATVKSANQAMLTANALIAKNQQQVQQALQDFTTLSAKLIEQQKKLDPILANMDKVTDSLSQVEMVALANDMRSTIHELDKTLKGINNAEGTVGKLVKDEALYENMNKTMQDLDKLFVDLQENPKRYVHFSVFGRKDKSKDKKKEEE